MNIKFEENELCWIVREEGIDTDKAHFEIIGLILKDKESPCLKIDDDFSGILELNTMKEILNFMEDNQIIIIKNKSEEFEVHMNSCVDNDFNPDKYSLLCKMNNLRETIKFANNYLDKELVEYGYYIDDSCLSEKNAEEPISDLWDEILLECAKNNYAKGKLQAQREELKFLEKHYKTIREMREFNAGLQPLQYPVQERISKLKKE